MENVLKQLRMRFTVTSCLLAGLVLVLLLGAFLGILFASTELTSAQLLDNMLDSPDVYYEDEMGRRAFAFYYEKGSSSAEVFVAYRDVLSAYGDDAERIVGSAVNVNDGKFRIGSMYFRVMSRSYGPGRTLYAVMDRTSDKQNLASTGILLAFIYVAAIIVIALISYIFSSRALSPVAESFKKQRDLIANASHELKTPLTIISTNLSVMKSEPDSTVADNAKWIDAIDAQIQRMNGLIVSMLQLSKMENAAVPKTELDFSEIAEGACLGFDAVCFEKGITLVSKIDPGIKVMGDRDALERLVTSLLDNATKYCGAHGKVGLRLYADKKVRMQVMNTGSALTEEDAKHVFDRFYRSDGARSNSDGKSFGLGLAIAQATVFAHGGNITCRGIEGKGTVFEVTLPLLKQNARKEPAKLPPAD